MPVSEDKEALSKLCQLMPSSNESSRNSRSGCPGNNGLLYPQVLHLRIQLPKDQVSWPKKVISVLKGPDGFSLPLFPRPYSVAAIYVTFLR